jgi:hypothetical protein
MNGLRYFSNRWYLITLRLSLINLLIVKNQSVALQRAPDEGREIEPASAQEIEGIVQKMLATPKPLADKIRAVLESMKTAK